MPRYLGDRLCESCQGLDLHWLLTERTHEGCFVGVVKDIFDRSWRCSLCSLLTQGIRKIWLLDGESHLYPLNRKKPMETILLATCHLQPTERWSSLITSTVYQDNSTRIGENYSSIMEACKPAGTRAHMLYNLRVTTDPDPWEFDLLAADTPKYVKSMHCDISSRSRSYELHTVWNHPKATHLSEWHKLYGGRLLDINQANLALAREWLSGCESTHSSSCAEPMTSEKMLLPFRLVEVRSRRLVEVSTVCRYVTLSYVWGGAKPDNRWQHMQEVDIHGRIYTELPSKLPATIENAIAVTKEIGELYLWVDQLCILQDDTVDKPNLITKMDRIYAHSVVTIVAASDNADAGLAGLGTRKRVERQIYATIQGFVLCQRLANYSLVLQTSRWYTRAWTYQEYRLSRRCLVFSDSQMFFQCRQTVFFEDTIAEPYVSVDLKRIDERVNARAVSQRERLWPLLNAWPAYRSIVEEYTKRSLSHVSDTVDALTGLLNTISIELHGFHRGLPSSEFHRALLWQFLQGSFARHEADQSREPSWTWAGWNHQSHLRASQGDLGGWLCHDGVYGGVEERQAVPTYVLELRSGSIKVTSLSSSNIKECSHRKLPDLAQSSSILTKLESGTSLIRLYTHVAHLAVSEHGFEFGDLPANYYEYLLLDFQDDIIGYIRLSQEQRREIGNRRLMCIALSYSKTLVSLNSALEDMNGYKDPSSDIESTEQDGTLSFATIMGLCRVRGFLERIGIGQVSRTALIQEQRGGEQWVTVA